MRVVVFEDDLDCAASIEPLKKLGELICHTEPARAIT